MLVQYLDYFSGLSRLGLCIPGYLNLGDSFNPNPNPTPTLNPDSDPTSQSLPARCPHNDPMCTTYRFAKLATFIATFL